MKKKTKRKSIPKPKGRKGQAGSKVNRKRSDTGKEKEELIRIWDEDLCE